MNFPPITPPQGAEYSLWHDLVFYALTALTLLFTVIVLVLVVFFVVRFRASNKVDRSNPKHEHLVLELTWTVIPLGLALVMFSVSAKLYIDQRTPPEDAIPIYVIGKQWMWHAQHANGIRENNELHVPVGKPVQVTLISQDVLHSFYIPAFRVQYHAVPGRYTTLWFKPTKPGRYKLLCAMHCGGDHSEMVGWVTVLPQNEYQEWLASGGNRFSPVPATMAQRGEKLFKEKNCANCHVAQDTPRAPTLVGLPGQRVELANGRTVEANDDYLRRGILNPYAELRKGYENTMPVYEDLSEEDVLNLIAYIKSLGLQSPAVDATLVAARNGAQP